MSKDNKKPITKGIQTDLIDTILIEGNQATVSIDKTPGSNQAEENNFNNVKSIFYDVITNKDDNFIKAKINHEGFISVINEFGVFKYNLETDYIFVLIKKGIINEISTTDIQGLFIEYLNTLPDELEHPKCSFRKQYIKNEVFEKNANLFSKTKLSLLPSANIELNEDTKDKAFFYYKNGFVECSANGYKLLDYKQLKGFIWKSQIIDRDFKNLNYHTIDEKLINGVVVAKFYYLIANSSMERLNSLCSFSGYLMHNYFDTDLKALLLTDSKLSDVAEGRTGKGLYVLTLSFVRNIVSIDGKDFKNDDKHKYQNVDLSTQIVHLEDTKPHFNIEDLFNVITAGFKVEPKGKISFIVRAKLVLSCNKTINIQGSSAKGRTIEFELSEHFSDIHTPEMEFKHRFFTSWTILNEWEKYDNFMMLCLSHYLKNGLIAAESINLSVRRVRDNTCLEFGEWIEGRKIDPGVEYDKREIHTEFLNEYEDIKTDNRKNKNRVFVKWLKTWASANDLNCRERKTNGKNMIEFLKKN